MANHKSAIKRIKQSERRRLLNRRNRSKLRTAIKALRTAITTGDQSTAQTLLTSTVSLLDKSIQKGTLHQNAASRYKSRLTQKVNGMTK